MLKTTFKHSGRFGKLALLLFLVLFFSLIGLALNDLLFGHATAMRVMKYRQLLLAFFMLLLPPVVAGYFWYDKPWQSYALHRLPSGRQTVLSVVLIFALAPLVNLLSYVNEQILVFPPFLEDLELLIRTLEERAEALTQQMLMVNTPGDLLLNLLVMGLLPAVSEELICRGALQNIFSEKGNKYLSVWLVAAIFSLIHFQMYGFLPRMALGALLGYLLLWSGSLWLPVLVHFVNNAVVVLTAYFGKGNGVFEAAQHWGKAETWWYGVISGVVSGLLIWYMLKRPGKDANA